MALPSYTDQGIYDPLNAGMGRNQIQHQRQRDRRQDRRARRRDRRNAGPVAPPSPVPPTTPFEPQNYGGYEGPVTAPVTSSAHPFFDPNSNYATTGGSKPYTMPGGPGSTPLNIWGTNESPEGYYYGAMNQRGYGGLDAKSQAVQSMYGDVARGYQAAKGFGNFEMWFPEFVNQWDPTSVIESMSEEQLGIDSNRYRTDYMWGLRG